MSVKFAVQGHVRSVEDGLRRFPTSSACASSNPVPASSNAHINDNGDDEEDIGVRFQPSGLSAIDYTIENPGFGCKP